MIPLFHIPEYTIYTSSFSNLLHDTVCDRFERDFCQYVGAKYGCLVNSATNAIFLSLLNRNVTVTIPSMIPPVVANAIITAGNRINFKDDVDWIGWSYVLHTFPDYKIIDSAQRVDAGQFENEADDQDLMIFSFYPTKPVGSCDGGIIVSNDAEKIKRLKTYTLNGMTPAANNWDRKIEFVGYKMYMNSIQCHIASQNLIRLDSKKYQLEQTRSYYNEKFGLSNKSHHLYTISVDDNQEFMAKMKEKGISCGIHYNSLHDNPVYSQYVDGQIPDLPKTQQQSKRIVSIPFNEALTIAQIKYIVEAVKPYAR